jgi:hypothetical protein
MFYVGYLPYLLQAPITSFNCFLSSSKRDNFSVKSRQCKVESEILIYFPYSCFDLMQHHQNIMKKYLINNSFNNLFRAFLHIACVKSMYSLFVIFLKLVPSLCLFVIHHSHSFAAWDPIQYLQKT